MIDPLSQRTFDSFRRRSLPKPEWTHEAHLRVCWVALSRLDPDDALAFLRRGIREYNAVTGVANTPTSGYHETLTRYYVGAVAGLGATAIDEVLAAPRCETAAPLRHWSRELLFSRSARADWVEPDVEPLPWPPVVSRPTPPVCSDLGGIRPGFRFTSAPACVSGTIPDQIA